MNNLLTPEYELVVGIVVSLLAVMLLPRKMSWAYGIALIALLASGADTWRLWMDLHGHVYHLFQGAIQIDNYSLLINGMVLLAAASSFLLAWDPERYGPEFPALMLLSTLGVMALGVGANLMVLFLGIEMLSLPLYILVALTGQSAATEGGLKYLLLGAYSSGIMLFGLGLIYGATGSMAFTHLATTASLSPLLIAGLILTIIGLVFKLGIVPFHMWVPDVYEAAPTPVTNFMAFGTKVGAAAILLRFLAVGFVYDPSVWGPLLGYLAVLTMIVGSLLALVQKDLKRLLAYSGMSQAGFLLIGLIAHSNLGARALLFFLVTYGFAVIGAFAVVKAVAGRRESASVEDLRNLAWQHPVMAAMMIIVMLSFAGIPLTGGFIGKLYLIQAALVARDSGIAIALVIATLLGLGAYLRPIQAMFSRTEASEPAAIDLSFQVAVVMGVASIATLFLGIYPGPVVHMVNQSTSFFMMR